MAKKLLQPVSLSAMAKPSTADNGEKNRPLNGVLLLVPILAILALLGISLAGAAIFPIGFWPALGWTTLVVVGAILLMLAVAILRGR